MTRDPSDNLPLYAIPETMEGIPRAGSRGEQVATQDSAWEMLETFHLADGEQGSRLSNDWLGRHGWRVQLVHHADLAHIDHKELPRALAAAALRHGKMVLFGASMMPGRFRPSAVWRVPPEMDAIGRFFEAHRYGFHMLFPADRSFAIHGNEDFFAAFAGPEDFLRDALPAGFIGRDATRNVVSLVEDEFGEGAVDDMLAHYAPFLLDD